LPLPDGPLIAMRSLAWIEQVVSARAVIHSWPCLNTRDTAWAFTKAELVCDSTILHLPIQQVNDTICDGRERVAVCGED